MKLTNWQFLATPTSQSQFILFNAKTTNLITNIPRLIPPVLSLGFDNLTHRVCQNDKKYSSILIPTISFWKAPIG